MKKLLALLVLMIALYNTGRAQNIQLHYDFGRTVYKEASERPRLTTTVEMFRPDKWGNTFFFVDMDYADGKVASAYWEIARELRFWKAPVALHVEYNGGLNYINDAYLAGATYSWNKSDYTAGFSFMTLYKYLRKNATPHSWQLTATWYYNFCKGKFSFNGFADFWKEKHVSMDGKTHNLVFITEPQFWVNLNKFNGVNDNFNLSIGTEWEISNNFAIYEGWKWMPTLAVKWTF